MNNVKPAERDNVNAGRGQKQRVARWAIAILLASAACQFHIRVKGAANAAN